MDSTLSYPPPSSHTGAGELQLQVCWQGQTELLSVEGAQTVGKLKQQVQKVFKLQTCQLVGLDVDEVRRNNTKKRMNNKEKHIIRIHTHTHTFASPAFPSLFLSFFSLINDE